MEPMNSNGGAIPKTESKKKMPENEVAVIFVDSGMAKKMLYRKNKDMGNAIRRILNQKICKREEFSVAVKLWLDQHDPAPLEPCLRQLLEILGLEFIDILKLEMLKGYACPEYVEMYQAMKKLMTLGLVKEIAITNHAADKDKGISPMQQFYIESFEELCPVMEVTHLPKRQNFVLDTYNLDQCFIIIRQNVTQNSE